MTVQTQTQFRTWVVGRYNGHTKVTLLEHKAGPLSNDVTRFERCGEWFTVTQTGSGQRLMTQDRMVAIETWHRWVAECEGWHACKNGVARNTDPFASEAWLRGWDDAAGATCDYLAMDEEYRAQMSIGQSESLEPMLW